MKRVKDQSLNLRYIEYLQQVKIENNQINLDRLYPKNIQPIRLNMICKMLKNLINKIKKFLIKFERVIDLVKIVYKVNKKLFLLLILQTKVNLKLLDFNILNINPNNKYNKIHRLNKFNKKNLKILKKFKYFINYKFS